MQAKRFCSSRPCGRSVRDFGGLCGRSRSAENENSQRTKSDLVYGGTTSNSLRVLGAGHDSVCTGTAIPTRVTRRRQRTTMSAPEGSAERCTTGRTVYVQEGSGKGAMHTRMHACTHEHLSQEFVRCMSHVRAHMHKRAHMRMRACTCVCVRARVHAHTPLCVESGTSHISTTPHQQCSHYSKSRLSKAGLTYGPIQLYTHVYTHKPIRMPAAILYTISMGTCVYTCPCTCLCMSIHMSVHMCVYTCVCACLNIRLYRCLYTCLCTCLYICVCTCLDTRPNSFLDTCLACL